MVVLHTYQSKYQLSPKQVKNTKKNITENGDELFQFIVKISTVGKT